MKECPFESLWYPAGSFRRNGRAVEGTCLENKQSESSRGFKSYFLRQMIRPAFVRGFFLEACKERKERMCV